MLLLSTYVHIFYPAHPRVRRGTAYTGRSSTLRGGGGPPATGLSPRKIVWRPSRSHIGAMFASGYIRAATLYIRCFGLDRTAMAAAYFDYQITTK